MPFALSALPYIQKHTQYPWIIVERWIQEDLKYLYWLEDWLHYDKSLSAYLIVIK
jgi:hypothetical protein